MFDFCPANHTTLSSNVSCTNDESNGLRDVNSFSPSALSITSEGYINYTSIIFCNSQLNKLGIAFSIIWLAMLFTSLATTADEFFCPSLEKIAKTLTCSQNVAGVTLLAFGNGAPEIFASLAGTTHQRSELVISYLMGSGVFLTCVVAGTIIFVKPFKMVELPFLRDVIFYIAATFWTFYVLYNGEVNLFYALGFILLYLLYLTIVLVAHQLHQRWMPRTTVQTAAVESGVSCRSSFALSGDEITPWGGPPFIKRSWSDDTEYRLSVSHARFHPSVITEESYERSNVEEDEETFPSTVHCEHCFYETRNRISLNTSKFCNWYSVRFMTLLRELSPINILYWNRKSVCGKIISVIQIPAMAVLKLTVPVVTHWCQPLNALHCVISPMFFLFAIKCGTTTIYRVIPMWGLVLGIGLVFTISVFVTSDLVEPPKYHMLFALLGFVSSITWVYIIANEIVAVLVTLGYVFHISDSILGVTVLAWGNSISDVVSDVSIAKEGYPQMGISACFGGPLFNLLIGLGISFTTAILHTPMKVIKITLKNTTHILIGFLFASLVSSLVIVPSLKFNLKPWYSLYLYILYVIFLGMVLCNEFGAFS